MLCWSYFHFSRRNAQTNFISTCETSYDAESQNRARNPRRSNELFSYLPDERAEEREKRVGVFF